MANLTDDELSDDEIIRTTSRVSPPAVVPIPMEPEEPREVEEEEEDEDVPEGGLPVCCGTLYNQSTVHVRPNTTVTVV